MRFVCLFADFCLQSLCQKVQSSLRGWDLSWMMTKRAWNPDDSAAWEGPACPEHPKNPFLESCSETPTQRGSALPSHFICRNGVKNCNNLNAFQSEGLPSKHDSVVRIPLPALQWCCHALLLKVPSKFLLALSLLATSTGRFLKGASPQKPLITYRGSAQA